MNTETKTIRILTADHHALLRHGIASLVEIEPDMEPVAQAATDARQSLLSKVVQKRRTRRGIWSPPDAGQF